MLPVLSAVLAGVRPAALPTSRTHSCSRATASILQPNLQAARKRQRRRGPQSAPRNNTCIPEPRTPSSVSSLDIQGPSGTKCISLCHQPLSAARLSGSPRCPQPAAGPPQGGRHDVGGHTASRRTPKTAWRLGVVCEVSRAGGGWRHAGTHPQPKFAGHKAHWSMVLISIAREIQAETQFHAFMGQKKNVKVNSCCSCASQPVPTPEAGSSRKQAGEYHASNNREEQHRGRGPRAWRCIAGGGRRRAAGGRGGATFTVAHTIHHVRHVIPNQH